MYEQVTKEWSLSIQAYNQVYHNRRKYKNNYIYVLQKNVG